MHDGETPAAITQKAKEQVLQYPTVQLINDTANVAVKTEYGFDIKTISNDTYCTKKIIFATGISDIRPDIIGFGECWGISVLHCPYCHGYEVKNKALGIIANGDVAFEMCKLIQHWSKELTLFCNGKSTLSEVQYQQLKKHNITIIEKEISALAHDNGYIKHIAFNDGTSQNLAAIFSRVAFEQNSKMPESLGCMINEQGFIQVDAFQKTSIASVYATGDCTTMFRAVSFAVGMGTLTGAMVNKELIDEAF